MKEPFFSIIIPTYNRANLVEKTVTSFLQQTYPHFELLVIDDGGTDNTKDVLALLNDDRVKYVWKENGERGAARNYGASKAKGDYLNYFDSDDFAYPMHLEIAAATIEKLQQPMVFHLGYEMKTIDKKIIFQRTEVNGLGNERLLKVNYVNPNPVFVHRNTLKEVVVNQDRGLSGTEDWLYHLQLAARYDFIAYDKVITSCMIQHDERSMNTHLADGIILRNTLLMEYLKADAVFIGKYGGHVSSIEAEMFGLAALHFALEKKKRLAIKYFVKSFTGYPALLFKRRTLAIVKYLVLRW